MTFTKTIFAVVVLLFVIYMLLLSRVENYGISWDEPYQRILGKATYDYVFHSDPALLQLGDKYYGSFYEMGLVAGEKFFKLAESRDVYLFRHSVNFSLFFAGVISFYFFAYNIWKSRSMAVVGCFLLLSYPRILADSYYNSKDIPFMVFYLLTGLALLVYLGAPNYKKLFLLALLTAMSIATRLAGIYLFMTVIIFFSLQIISKTFQKNFSLQDDTLKIVVYMIISIFGTYALWPILWENPANFYYALQSMSTFDWDLAVLFQGSFVLASDLPWYYLPVWIGITTPIGLLLAFFIGIVKYFAGFKKQIEQLLRNVSHSNDIVYKRIFIISPLLLIPLLSVIIFRPTIYDGWRHFYFLYPFIVLFALHGLNAIWKLSVFNKPILTKLLVVLLVGVTLGEQLIFIAKNHPYEFVFFNKLAGKDYSQIKKNYELDYWGVSSKDVLEYLATTTSIPLMVTTDSHAVVHNHALLPEEIKQNIRFQEIEKIDSADVFIGSYRWHPYEYPCGQPLFSSVIESVPLVSAYDAKNCTTEELLKTIVL